MVREEAEPIGIPSYHLPALTLSWTSLDAKPNLLARYQLLHVHMHLLEVFRT